MSNNRRTVSDIKTAVRSKIHSKPRVVGSEFLEMFILEKNRSRLEQEKAYVEKRQALIDKDIALIESELEILKDRVSQNGKSMIEKPTRKKQESAKKIKTMTIDY